MDPPTALTRDAERRKPRRDRLLEHGLRGRKVGLRAGSLARVCGLGLLVVALLDAQGSELCLVLCDFGAALLVQLLLLANGHLIVLGENGKLALVEATPEEYREMASFRALRCDRCWTMPVLADGLLLVRDLENMACYDLRGK